MRYSEPCRTLKLSTSTGTQSTPCWLPVQLRPTLTSTTRAPDWILSTTRSCTSTPQLPPQPIPEEKVSATLSLTPTMIATMTSLHCKNKWVEITHAWLPELHTSKDNCNSGNQAWVTSTHLFLQCTDLHDGATLNAMSRRRFTDDEFAEKVASLNESQRAAYQAVVEFTHLLHGYQMGTLDTPPRPLRLFITGGAGTGKSQCDQRTPRTYPPRSRIPLHTNGSDRCGRLQHRQPDNPQGPQPARGTRSQHQVPQVERQQA